MRENSRARRGIAMLAIVIFLIFLLYGNMHRASVSSYLQSLDNDGSIVFSVNSQKITMPDFLSFDDFSEDEHGDHFQLVLKKETHIQGKNLIFMNTFFSMVLFPMLVFATSIRLFGRCLARLWHVIIYIHESDGGEIPLLC